MADRSPPANSPGQQSPTGDEPTSRRPADQSALAELADLALSRIATEAMHKSDDQRRRDRADERRRT